MKRLMFALSITVLSVITVTVLAMPLMPRIALRLISSAYGLDIKYDRVIKAGLNRIDLEQLNVTDRAKGIGIVSDKALLRLTFNGIDPRRARVGFDLYGVRFTKTKAETEAKYDTLDGLVSLPFSSNWVYEEISGKIGYDSGAVLIDDFMAKSPTLKLSFNGRILKNGQIATQIVIYFADRLTDKVPPELTKLVLKDELSGWKSLTVQLEGDYTMPNISLSSKLFRLNIAVKEK